MFNNQIFDSWLNKKSDEILSKVDKEKISTEEMIILVLKAQTNHFHHMDVDMREQFMEVNKRIDFVEKRIGSVDNRIDSLESKLEKRFEKIDQKIDNRFMWMIGITIAMSVGIYLKLFLG